MGSKTIPEQVLQTLRCSFCTEYLSVPPINMYPDDQNPLVTCGRCPVIFEQNPVRNVIYETVSSLYTFPCRYKTSGCLEDLKMTDVMPHEKDCKYRQYFCPMLPLGTCPWQGPVGELALHYQLTHSTYVLQDPSLEIDLINQYDENYIFFYYDKTFVFQIKHENSDSNVLYTYVRSIGPEADKKNYSFMVNFTTVNSCAKFLLDPLPIGDDASMSIDVANSAKVTLDEILVQLENPCQVICSVELVDTVRFQESESADDLLESVSQCSIQEDKFLRKIECPICSEHLLPPIFQCNSGHSFCERCKNSINECSICRGGIGNTRNYVLEALTEDINYPCKYADYGCAFSLKHNEFLKHLTECKFAPYNCLLKSCCDCNWKGKLPDMMEHVRSSHEDNVLDYEEINTYFGENEDYDDCRITSVFNNIFKLEYRYQDRKFYWSVQLIGPASEAVKYYFELDFVSKDGKLRTYFKRSCFPLTKESPFDNGTNFLMIPLDLIEYCISDDTLTYKCHIHSS